MYKKKLSSSENLSYTVVIYSLNLHIKKRQTCTARVTYPNKSDFPTSELHKNLIALKLK